MSQDTRARQSVLSGMRREAPQLLKLAGPLVAGQVASLGMMFTDTVMAGHHQALTLAAVGLGSAVFSPLVLLALGTLLVVSPYVAQHAGAGERQATAFITHQAMYLAGLLASVVFALTRYPEPLLRLFEIDAQMLAQTSAYLNAVGWGVFGLCAYSVLRFFSEGLSITRPTLLFAVGGLLLNAPLNAVLMNGLFGVPELGARGCGYATAIVFSCMALGMAAYVHHRHHYQDIALFRRWHRPAWQTLAELFGVGLPLGVSIFLEGTLFGVITLFIGSYGAEVTAAHQIGLSITHLVFMIPLGIGLALTVRVGTEVGRNSLAGVRRVARTGFALIACLQCLTATLLLLSHQWLPNIYTQQPEVRQIAGGLLLVAAIFQISDGMQMAASGALRGLKDTRAPMWWLIIAYWGLGIPAGWVLGEWLGLGVAGYWWGLVVGLSAAAIGLHWRFRHRLRALQTGRRGHRRLVDLLKA